MELWFTEEWLPGLRISVRVETVVYQTKTKYQTLAIYDTLQYGRMMVLDNAIQTTEKDEFLYHESIVHVPLFSHPNPEKVLIIGGGDGGSLREVLRHPCVKQATMVDIDGEVVEAARKYLPAWSSGFGDPRTNLIIGDGMDHVAKTRAEYDVIIIDSTDPVGPGEVLFEEDFYRNVRSALREGGIMTAQTESPVTEAPIVRKIAGRIAKVFPAVGVYTAPVPSYPGGWWGFTCGSLGPDPRVPVRTPDPSWGLRYYTPAIHARAFDLGPEMEKQILVPSSLCRQESGGN